MFIGTGTGELVALSLADGTLRWRYKAGESIGESSPAVAAGRVYIGDLEGVCHAVDVATGKAVWTFKTRSEIKSSPIVAGDLVLIGSYDGGLYAIRRGRRQGAVDGEDRELRARHARVSSTASPTSPGATRSFTRFACAMVGRLFDASATAYTGASVAWPAARRTSARSTIR